MSNVMKDIEERQGQKDIGKLGKNVYVGCMEDGSTKWLAFWITVAFYVACFKSNEENNDEGDDT